MSNYHKIVTLNKLYGNGVTFSTFRTTGIPYIMVARGGTMKIGANFGMNNSADGNTTITHACSFFVDNGAAIIIGNNVGISRASLVAIDNITIGDNVKIGGDSCIYTSDFHSIDPKIRASKYDLKNRKHAPVTICDNAFIGGHSIILKGVTIGENSVVGAGSVVTKSIPANQIWAGNPAKYIKDI